MSKTRILMDSSGDLTLETAKENNIRIIPLKLSIGDKVYEDKYEITSSQLYNLQRKEKVMSKTMQVTPAEFSDIFRQELENYDELILVTIASNASGTYQAACLARDTVLEEKPESKITVIDSRHLSFGYGFAALEGAKVLAAGGSSDEIIQRINLILDNLNTFFTVETLEYLKKGGRIKPTSAVVGGLLDVRPILQVADGLVSVTEKVRGEKKALQALGTLAKGKITDKDKCYVIILKSDVQQTVDILSKDMAEFLGRNPDYICELGPVISSHSGPGVIGICVINNVL